MNLKLLFLLACITFVSLGSMERENDLEFESYSFRLTPVSGFVFSEPVLWRMRIAGALFVERFYPQELRRFLNRCPAFVKKMEDTPWLKSYVKRSLLANLGERWKRIIRKWVEEIAIRDCEGSIDIVWDNGAIYDFSFSLEGPCFSELSETVEIKKSLFACINSKDPFRCLINEESGDYLHEDDDIGWGLRFEGD